MQLGQIWVPHAHIGACEVGWVLHMHSTAPSVWVPNAHIRAFEVDQVLTMQNNASSALAVCLTNTLFCATPSLFNSFCTLMHASHMQHRGLCRGKGAYLFDVILRGQARGGQPREGLLRQLHQLGVIYRTRC